MDTLPGSPWLILIHQLPPKPSYLRVKVWRRLQALGAIPIKNSVYVLPNTEEAREDFEWVIREIRPTGGEVSLCEARLVEGLTDEEIRASFQSAREKDYRALASDVRALAREVLPRRSAALSSEKRGPLDSGLERLRKRLTEIVRIDFFGAPGRAAVEGLLRELLALASSDSPEKRATAATRRAGDVQGRVWVTRTGVHIDRIASAWLIRRFIDPTSRFKFVAARGYSPEPEELRFDMFDADFTHDGALCTFEVLCRDFGLADPALRALGEIVHDIDLKEATFGRSETSGVDHLMAGIAWTTSADESRLAQGATVLDALYAYFRRGKR